MNKNRENFKKYSNDLYFHHLLVENERIRTLICQELILDREIVSTKLKNAQQYGKNFYEKKLILDILAIDDVGDLYNIELQTYGLNEEILVRFELYNAELLRQQVKQGEDYTSAHVVRSLIISYGHILDNAPLYKCYFRMVDDEHHIVYPFNRMEITIIQLEYINQVINEMTSFNQLMYLFKNEKPYDKIEIDYRIKEAIQMHDKYISSEESYLEYLDRLDNENIKFQNNSRETSDYTRKIISYIELHYMEDIGGKDFARACNLSETHMRRIFIESANITPSEYLNLVRIKKACEMLAKEKCSIEKVSNSVGYPVISTFMRNFKKITGISPNAWRRKALENPENVAAYQVSVFKGW